ncbi:hypothetical protein MKW94_012775 [Papaver nudicaule]|uniref:Uncharacterized protein n=1 Tax=Papaver nudicaule TaxID=74823 RepID=A0AA41VYY1_PAPNU|nr:hypothetical protein [Papaver nudicaule]
MASSRVLIILLALCVLPALLVEAVPAVPGQVRYLVIGYVYCDTCHLGCEHPLVTYIPGAIVKIECKDDKKFTINYSRQGVTDKDGKFTIEVREDHKDDFCFAVLVSSPKANCKKIVPGLDRVTAILTNENGLQETSPYRFVNSMGFEHDVRGPRCKGLELMYNSDV